MILFKGTQILQLQWTMQQSIIFQNGPLIIVWCSVIEYCIWYVNYRVETKVKPWTQESFMENIGNINILISVLSIVNDQLISGLSIKIT